MLEELLGGGGARAAALVVPNATPSVVPLAFSAPFSVHLSDHLSHSLAQRVDQLLEEVGPGELPFQLHYSPADLRALLGACMSQVGSGCKVFLPFTPYKQLCWAAWWTLFARLFCCKVTVPWGAG